MCRSIPQNKIVEASTTTPRSRFGQRERPPARPTAGQDNAQPTQSVLLRPNISPYDALQRCCLWKEGETGLSPCGELGSENRPRVRQGVVPRQRPEEVSRGSCVETEHPGFVDWICQRWYADTCARGAIPKVAAG